jgi:hypothetical protein
MAFPLRPWLAKDCRAMGTFLASVTFGAQSIWSCDSDVPGSSTSLILYEKQDYCSKVGHHDGFRTGI